MTSLPEGRFLFTFRGSAVQYDRKGGYFNQIFQGFQDGMSAVDFVAPLFPGGLQLVEVKDFTGHEQENWKRVTGKEGPVPSPKRPRRVDKTLHEEVAKKVMSTIWGLCSAWTKASQEDTAKELADILRGMNDERNAKLLTEVPLQIVLFLEGDFNSDTRSKKAVMKDLAEEIEQALPWFGCMVSVVDSDTCRVHNTGFDVEEIGRV